MTANFSNNTGSLQTNTSTYSYNETILLLTCQMVHSLAVLELLA